MPRGTPQRLFDFMSTETPRDAGAGTIVGRAGPAVSTAERVAVAVFAVALALATSVPYLIGWSRDRPSSFFNQTLVLEKDFNSYCSYVRQAADGEWLFRNQFAAERHQPAFFNLEFLAAGKLAALSGLSAGAALQAQRAVAAVAFVVVIHWVSSLLLKTPSGRWAAVLLITTGGGLGWLVELPVVGPSLRSVYPVDLYAGLHPFFWLFLHPHFLVAQLFSVLAQGLFLKAEIPEQAGGRLRYYCLAGVAAALCGLVRPYDMLHLQFVCSVYFVALQCLRGHTPLRDSWLRLLPALIPAPVLLYYFWLFRFHPIFQWWGRLGVLPPPPLMSLLLGIGWVLVVCLLGAWKLASAGSLTRVHAFLGLSSLCGLVLVYSYPALAFSFQLVTTLAVPAVLFATAWLEQCLGPLFRRPLGFRAVAVACLLANGATSLQLYHHKLSDVLVGRYRTDGESMAIFEWLRQHALPGDVVMAALRTSNRIPRYTPASVVAGYRFSTPEYGQREKELERFFDGRTRDVPRRRMIKHYGVRYVVFGVEERGSGYDPSSSPFLAEVFRTGEAAVYEVRLR